MKKITVNVRWTLLFENERTLPCHLISSPLSTTTKSFTLHSYVSKTIISISSPQRSLGSDVKSVARPKRTSNLMTSSTSSYSCSFSLFIVRGVHVVDDVRSMSYVCPFVQPHVARTIVAPSADALVTVEAVVRTPRRSNHRRSSVSVSGSVFQSHA